MKNAIISILSIWLSVPVLLAQQQWTLEQCIDYALKNNLTVESAELNVTVNKVLTDKAKLNYVPNLDFWANYRYDISRSLNPADYSFVENNYVGSAGAGLNLETPIFTGFKRYHNYKKSISDLNISVADLDVLKDDISLSIIMNYMSILLSKELIKSIEHQIEVSDINIKRQKRLIQEGVVTEENLHNLLIQKEHELYSLTEAEGNLKNAKINLCSLLNISDFDSFDVENDFSTDSISDNIKLADIISTIPFLPQLRSANFKRESAKHNLKMARSDLFPTISLSAGISGSYLDARKKMDGSYPFFEQLSNHRGGNIGLSLNIPISNYLQTKKNITIAKTYVLQVENEAKNSEKTLIEQISRIYVDMEVAKKKHNTALSSLEHTKILLSFMENKLSNGTLTINDYIIAKGNQLISESQASRAKYEYFFKLELLKFYYNHGN